MEEGSKDSTSFIWGRRGRMPIAPTGHKPMALFVDHENQGVQADPTFKLHSN